MSAAGVEPQCGGRVCITNAHLAKKIKAAYYRFPAAFLPRPVIPEPLRATDASLDSRLPLFQIRAAVG